MLLIKKYTLFIYYLFTLLLRLNRIFEFCDEETVLLVLPSTLNSSWLQKQGLSLGTNFGFFFSLVYTGTHQNFLRLTHYNNELLKAL